MVRSSIVVVGGGITGLTAAWEVVRTMPEAHVTLVDAADRPGGKLRREAVAGVTVDVGAESVLARRPEALELIAELGLDEEVEHPATTAASIWSRGQLHPMPQGTLMGIPASADSAAGILTADEVARAAQEEPWPLGPFEDVSVGDYVAARLGPAVVDRLVEPLLGGVYAGRAHLLSLRACLPSVFDAAERGESLSQAAAATAAAAAETQAQGAATPVFAGVRGGVGRIAEVLVERLRAAGVVIRSGTIARELARRPEGGWTVVLGSRAEPEPLPADAVVLAVPAAPASRLLSPHAPDAARVVSEIEYASMAIVTLAVARSERLAESGLDGRGSGFLVPPVDGRSIKASTFTSAKWRWAAEAAGDLFILRASVGRHQETWDLRRSDTELVALAVAEISEALGHQLPAVVDAHVQRWGGALPQYAVGHVERVERALAELSTLEGVAVAGAAYHGVGVPACIADGRAAARVVTTHLRARTSDAGE